MGHLTEVAFVRVEIVEVNFIVGISGPLPARRWRRRGGRWRGRRGV